MSEGKHNFDSKAASKTVSKGRSFGLSRLLALGFVMFGLIFSVGLYIGCQSFVNSLFESSEHSVHTTKYSEFISLMPFFALSCGPGDG